MLNLPDAYFWPGNLRQLHKNILEEGDISLCRYASLSNNLQYIKTDYFKKNKITKSLKY